MCRCLLLGLAAALVVSGEVRTLTLKEAAELALRQSPEVLLARLEERRAGGLVEVARDPFVPKVFAGSGLAYSNGFPMSIEGSAPSIVQARAVASVYNRTNKLLLAQAREQARGAQLESAERREEVVGRVIATFLDAERKGRLAEYAERQVASAEKVAGMMRSRVEEGRELALEGKRAELEVAKARQRQRAIAAERDAAEATLAYLLGLSPGERVRPAGEERTLAEAPATAEEAVREALSDNREIKRLESSLVAKGFEVAARRAERYPSLELVAQYGLFARFNNYEDFFRKFQRNNGQLGVSIQVPLLFGSGARGRASIAEAEAAQVRIRINQARSRIALEAEKQFAELEKAEAARQVSRLELEVAREALAVALARFEEGRAGLRQVEEARMAEQEKWMVYYDTVAQAEAARYALLERTGKLMAALR
jgi:outer membrane protein TolC